jgi:hypothetical protein
LQLSWFSFIQLQETLKRKLGREGRGCNPRHKSIIQHPQREKRESAVRFEVFTAVTMKNGVFWDVTPCSSYKSHTA